MACGSRIQPSASFQTCAELHCGHTRRIVTGCTFSSARRRTAISSPGSISRPVLGHEKTSAFIAAAKLVFVRIRLARRCRGLNPFAAIGLMAETIGLANTRAEARLLVFLGPFLALSSLASARHTWWPCRAESFHGRA